MVYLPIPSNIFSLGLNFCNDKIPYSEYEYVFFRGTRDNVLNIDMDSKCGNGLLR